MNTFLSDIIDCVALPSTSDTPVRLLRKCNSCNESPSAEAELDLTLDTSDHSTVSSVVPNAIEPIKSILTADGIIDDEDDEVVPNNSVDDQKGLNAFGIDSSHSFIDDGTAKIFEEAFAAFLCSNPGFSSISYTTLIRLREKLLVQSAKNAKVEAELRMQLEQLKEENRRSELMLQKELLEASNTKILREAELRKHMQESRDDRADIGSFHSSLMTTSPAHRIMSPPSVGCSPMNACYPPSMQSSRQWQMSYGEEHYQDGVRKSKMEQAHMIAQVQKMKLEKMKREVPDVLSGNVKL